MSKTIRCPECDRPVPEGRPGKKLYCKRCDLEFRPARRDRDDEDDRPARGRKKSNALGTLVLIGVPFAVVAVGFLIARSAGAFNPERATRSPEDDRAWRAAELAHLAREVAYASERIELFEPILEPFLKDTGKGKLAFFVRARVKYRFIVRTTNTKVRYHISVRTTKGGIAQWALGGGKEFAPAGELVSEFQLSDVRIRQTVAEIRGTGATEFRPEPDVLPTTGTFTVTSAQNTDGKEPLVTEVKCAIPKQDAYPLP